jgi:menaquinone-dependent protoporphyrinogen oxidase
MRVLVAFASRHGATAGIAERIADTIRADGHVVDALQIPAPAADPNAYDAVVIGSSVYLGHWEKSAKAYVHEHRDVLAAKPVWLFSSGPLGDEDLDEQGRDKRVVAEPSDLPELVEAVGPREHQVFFGVLDPKQLGLGPKLMRMLPAGRKVLPAGDFRDWAEIDEWSHGIARTLDAP